MSITIGDMEKTVRVKNIQHVLEYYGVEDDYNIEEILRDMIHAEESDWR